MRKRLHQSRSNERILTEFRKAPGSTSESYSAAQLQQLQVELRTMADILLDLHAEASHKGDEEQILPIRFDKLPPSA
jgi:predicted deacylase